MARGWMLSLGLSGFVLFAAAVVQGIRTEQAAGASTVPAGDERAIEAETDPCFRYGRFECCVRPEDR